MSLAALNPTDDSSICEAAIIRVADVSQPGLHVLLARFGLTLVLQPAGEAIVGSFWGAPEAGIVSRSVYVRDDTPVHSLLHEMSHIVCMSEERRAVLCKDAGGSDLEESAVCYLQILLADQIDSVGSSRLMRDMDRWGYSFRLGCTARWFAEDAADAREWLLENELITAAGLPSFRLRD